MAEVIKAIVPIAGLGTRFLPLSKILPKEFVPVVEKPMLYYTLEELKASGVQQIAFIVSPLNRSMVEDYLKRNINLEKVLEQRKQEDLLHELKKSEEALEGLSFSFISAKPLGDGYAILQARKFVGDDPCFVMYPDDIVESKIPCAAQLAQVYKTSEKPVMGLYRLPRERLPLYGVVQCNKIANRLFMIKDIVEKPALDEAPSDLAIVGRRIITPEIFEYLKKTKPNKKGEIILTDAFSDMVRDGKVVYGYEFEGRWLECGNKLDWLQTSLYLLLKHPELGSLVKKFIREEKLI